MIWDIELVLLTFSQVMVFPGLEHGCVYSWGSGKDMGLATGKVIISKALLS